MRPTRAEKLQPVRLADRIRGTVTVAVAKSQVDDAAWHPTETVHSVE
jgi:hypothetical protein